MIRRTALLALVTLAVTTLGCGKPSAPVAECKGTVKYKDAPVAGATVTMQNADGSMIATGLTDDAGAFTMSTFFGGETYQGAPIGPVKISISKVKSSGVTAPTDPNDPNAMAKAMEQYMKANGGGAGGAAGAPQSEIPPHYSNVDTSGLSQTIDADASKNSFDFVLTDQ
jgi:hypothetical protein